MKNHLLIFLFTLFSTTWGFAQGEANNWYFGQNAGISFNTNPPTVLLNGQLATNEGCSSISDENGNLLFYTDGRTIWNSNHQIMPNADYFGGTGLWGDPSSTSSALIVPHPTDPDLYFVFTVDEPHHDNAAAYPNPFSGSYSDNSGTVPQADDGYNHGLNYSVVDMSLQNGLGDVLLGEHNKHLITYDDAPGSEEIKYKCSEKITAVKGADCSSIWLLTHFIDSFYAFEIDANGVNTNPVISTVGPTVPISSYRRAAIGYMKVSPNGKKILVAHNTKSFNQQTGSESQDGGIYLYDFNDNTGVVSNNVALIENVNAYGVEFSMESTKAYGSFTLNGNAKLYQWDLSSPNIANSAYSFSGVSGASGTALQLAPNGKIYRSLLGESLLGVINNPELIGAAANYSENTGNGAIALQGRVATFGLPPFIQSIFSSRVNIVDTSEEIKTDLNLCDGETYTLSYENIPNASYTWYQNGTLLPGETTHNLTISQPVGVTLPYLETYKLVFDLNDGSCPFVGIANVTYYPYPAIKDAVLEQCLDYETETAFFDLNQAKNQILNGLDPSEYDIFFHQSLSQAQNNTGIISTVSSYENSVNPEILGVRVVHKKSGCHSVSELKLIVQGISKLGEDLQLIYCKEQYPEKVTLSTNIPNNEISAYTFLWQPNQETTPSIQVNIAGTYSVLVTKLNTTCSSERVFEIIPSNIAAFTLEQTDASQNNTITVLLSEGNNGDYVFALDNINGPYQISTLFENVSPGFHTVYVKDLNGCGISKKEVGIIGIMEFFTPNNDGANDRWKLTGTLYEQQPQIEMYIYDRYGKLLYSSSGRTAGWDGTYNGKRMPSNDYWYCIVLKDGRSLKGNFTLKR
ncbi:MAG TPA: T9SS type B sorting domain-containing protein [Flavobacteriaceae bacterium]|nr:T9SS type B sorting domain-containing protein [Flavobacteriaceae bacterium]